MAGHVCWVENCLYRLTVAFFFPTTLMGPMALCCWQISYVPIYTRVGSKFGILCERRKLKISVAIGGHEPPILRLNIEHSEVVKEFKYLSFIIQ